MSTLSSTTPFPGILASLDELRGMVAPRSEFACRTVTATLDRHVDQAPEDRSHNTLS